MDEPLRLVAAENAPRLDRWLADHHPDVSRARWQRAIAAGLVKVNDAPARASCALRAGDRIEATIPPPETAPARAVAEEIPLDVIYEDDHLLCLNKPPGLVVHPAAGNWQGTLVNAVLHRCAAISPGADPLRPGIVHRLDKDTSGCILVAKTERAHAGLARQFAERTARKTYLAVVRGKPRAAQGVIKGAIARHPARRKQMAVSSRPGAREAETAWRLLASDGRLSLLECRPKTGRTHQIRVHLKHLGHPIAGDRLYGGGADFPRQLLHAWKLEIHHPVTGKDMTFLAPVPPDFPLRPAD
ncbi:MAG: RluA family pseudouridine synthase [Chthoniobacterales bacterium]|nr:RluA family pseudouridine synthase [Chthoniobacterales bacterium]